MRRRDLFRGLAALAALGPLAVRRVPGVEEEVHRLGYLRVLDDYGPLPMGEEYVFGGGSVLQVGDVELSQRVYSNEWDLRGDGDA